MLLVDVFTSFIFTKPIKNKTGSEVAAAFGEILTETDRKPIFLTCDAGTEFLGYKFADLLKENNIQLHVASGKWTLKNSNVKTLSLCNRAA